MIPMDYDLFANRYRRNKPIIEMDDEDEDSINETEDDVNGIQSTDDFEITAPPVEAGHSLGAAPPREPETPESCSGKPSYTEACCSRSANDDDVTLNPNELPVISIEDEFNDFEGNLNPHRRHPNADSRTRPAGAQLTVRRRRPWLWPAACALLTIAAVALILAARHHYNYYYNIGVPIAVTPGQNIEKLASQGRYVERQGVTLTPDSILGVALNLYSLDGLKATLQLGTPDSTDTSIILCSRSADYTADLNYLGTLVVEGKELQSDNTRLGYVAMAGSNVVIGVSRSEKVKDYCVRQGGSFFRQFVLLSGGVIPRDFPLHGKVERRAIGRTSDDRLFYVATRHKETLWDFADALREYGFIDAVYITGGNSYSYYRNSKGRHLFIGPANELPNPNHRDIAPWIVFRKSRPGF